MIDLGTGPTPSALGAVTLSTDELVLLVDLLELGPMPTVLMARPHYDSLDTQDKALRNARVGLEERMLLAGKGVHEELAVWLQTLAWPHWVVAVRLYTGATTNRLCLARGDDLSVRCLRGPRSYLLGPVEAGDSVASIIGALPVIEPVEFAGLTAPTIQLQEVFGLLGDGASTSRQLRELGIDAAAADTVGRALVRLSARAEIVGVRYGNGKRDVAPGNVALFDTHDGRIVATSSIARDGTKWSSLSSGTNARLRQALTELVRELEAEVSEAGNH